MTEWTPEEERVANWFSDHWWDGCEVKSGGGRIAACTGPCACREAARDVLAISAMQPRWRDVKTDPPPRDGWHILARLPDANTSYVICWTDKATGIRAELCHDKNPAGWRHAWDGYFFGVGEQPTHWMPLPPAPEPKP